MQVTVHAGDEVGSLGRARVLAGWSLAVVGSLVLTAVLVPFRSGSAPSFEALLYLVLAVACALVGGRWPAIVASVLGTLLLNYFFSPPLHSLSIASRANVLNLVVFVTTSIAVASVVDSAARRRHQATAARSEANTLAMLNRTVLGGEYDVPRLLDLVRDTFGAEEAVLLPASEVRAGDTAVQAAKYASRETPGPVLVLRGRSLDPAERRILAAFASHLSVLREREELARQTAAAHELEAGNRTRTALLAAVSHDLRTPLAGIKAAAETLRAADSRLAAEDRDELLFNIVGSTDRLTSIVADLLDMSRLQTGAVTPSLQTVSLDEVLARALRGMAGAERVRVPAGLPDVRADAGLLERVVANVVANAVRHSERVEVTAATVGPRVGLRVVDHGPGVAEGEKVRIFEPFQRLGDAPQGDGVGLGLAVARGLTEAQGGSVEVADTPGGGLTVVVDLAGGSQ